MSSKVAVTQHSIVQWALAVSQRVLLQHSTRRGALNQPQTVQIIKKKNCFKHTKCKDFYSITIHSDNTYAHLSPFNLLSAENFGRCHPLCARGFKANGLIWLPCCTVRHWWSGILPRERAAHRHVSSEGKRALADWFFPRSPINLHQRLHPN